MPSIVRAAMSASLSDGAVETSRRQCHGLIRHSPHRGTTVQPRPRSIARVSSRWPGDPTSASRHWSNALCGEKVSIVSDKPQTTRHRVRGVLTRDAHTRSSSSTRPVCTSRSPRSASGSTRPPSTASPTSTSPASCSTPRSASAAAIGGWPTASTSGKRSSSSTRSTGRAVARSARCSTAASSLDAAAYVPVSARTGDGLDILEAEVAVALAGRTPVLSRRHGA